MAVQYSYPAEQGGIKQLPAKESDTMRWTMDYQYRMQAYLREPCPPLRQSSAGRHQLRQGDEEAQLQDGAAQGMKPCFRAEEPVPTARRSCPSGGRDGSLICPLTKRTGATNISAFSRLLSNQMPNFAKEPTNRTIMNKFVRCLWIVKSVPHDRLIGPPTFSANLPDIKFCKTFGEVKIIPYF